MFVAMPAGRWTKGRREHEADLCRRHSHGPVHELNAEGRRPPPLWQRPPAVHAAVLHSTVLPISGASLTIVCQALANLVHLQQLKEKECGHSR